MHSSVLVYVNMHMCEKLIFFLIFYKFTELFFASLISLWMVSSLHARSVIPSADICQEYTKTSTALMQQQNPGN